MKLNWKWIVGVVLALALLFALPSLFQAFFGYGYGGMTLAPGASAGAGGYRSWNHPMMGYGYTPFGGLFMGLGMLLVWAIPLGLLFLVIFGAVRLATKSGKPDTTQSCGNCGKAVQPDWNTCPYCGTAL